MKNLFRILLPLFLIAAATSCASKSDIDDLQEQIDNLKTGKIATIEQQLTGIQASITSLQATDTQLSSFVSTLQLETSGIKADLSSKEKALSDRIDALKKYVDDELGKNRDWASATFSTLEQYQSLLSELAGIRQSISSLETNLRAEIESSIAASESSMKGWVSEQLSGYYTITQMDAKLRALADSDAAAQQSISELADALAKAKTDLTAAYTQAIAEAIANHEGTITTKIAADIKTATDALQAQIDALDLRIAALEGMIQSISIIPAYSNGSVSARFCILTVDCIASPASAVQGLTKDNIRIFVTSATTKAASITKIAASEVQIDETNGAVEVKADISSVFPVPEDETLMAAINVSVGKTDYTTPFIEVTREFCEYVDLGLSVKWASCNLGASRPEEYGGYCQWAGLEDVTDKSIYLDWSNCPYHTGSSFSTGWTKYNTTSSYGPVDNKTILEPEDDVVRVMLGGGWRMPTWGEWYELENTDNCSWTWTSINGINGYKVQSLKTGFTDKWIFLPAAGYCRDDDLYSVGSYGYYWSSSLGTFSPNGAYSFYFNSDYVRTYDRDRCNGQSVRPVMEEGSPAPSVVPVESVSLDKTAATLNVNGTVTLSATVLPDNATDKSVSWSSNNTGVATVDASGKVTAVAAGTATITVTTTDGGKTATCTVTVYDLPDGALSGEFSVSATKKVHFSQGNLQATYNSSESAYTWGFAANQYDYIGKAAGNTTIDSQTNGAVVDLFGWSTSTNGGTSTTDNYGIKTSTNNSYYSGDFYDWGKAVGDGSTWRTLSKDEWTYLFNNHSKKWATVNGVNGYVIAPDGFEGELADSYENDAELVTAGNLVFLPAAGDRGGSNVGSVGDSGYYWSSTAYDERYAYFVAFRSSFVYPGRDDLRTFGFSVRLITESK